MAQNITLAPLPLASGERQPAMTLLRPASFARYKAASARAKMSSGASLGRTCAMPAEKVTRKSLDDADHRRLVEEALAEVDFSSLAGAEANGGEER